MKKWIATLLMLAFASPHALACPEETSPVAPLKVVALQDGREILANTDGLTAYVFDNDEGSTSVCYDSCAVTWPPILVADDTVLGKDLGVTIRKDGSNQLTHKGQPIYLFKRDKKEGDIFGDGVGQVWHLIELQ